MKNVVGSNRAIYVSLSLVCFILYMNANLFLASVPLDVNIRHTKSYETISTYDSQSSSKCLSFEGSMDELVKSSKQIFITMPAKAAGSSMKAFTQKCMSNHTVMEEDNFINSEKSVLNMMTQTYELPSIITGHIYKEKTMVDIVKGATDDSLVLYINRQETDRLVSAAQTVVDRMCEGKFAELEEFKDQIQVRYPDENNRQENVFFLRKNGECTIEEDALRDVLLQQKKEMGKSNFNSLSCSVFDAIEDNKPNMVVVDYKQAGRLQKLLAKYHCPEMLDEEAVHSNRGSTHVKKFVRLSNEEGREVLLSEWMEKKRDLIEWGFGMKKDISCQGKIRSMQRELSRCDDEMFHLSKF
mmetsp:Transcript_11016/g.13936  ORF Transcript_11016/g.13936 Transcript_11016/m.13936 type:complete len:355 (+) Transcript_11016:138-1202(+)|eukprot:CAMPEP_0203691490 /NCGR_PEP_ID=MMETSP0091-20130426/3786_1 /ASSEMBLY_ACC=CAM_ASM_001089 /TAXON_ID=426623 /ORGANISM="Chaetoceros affinis, Strain CCMP159" /LENGTH=354 /DNA_ID=CAMNT_0050562015 /DNA_START=38 /DNA_END=1102 /DNA_ORIENTATION=+